MYKSKEKKDRRDPYQNGGTLYKMAGSYEYDRILIKISGILKFFLDPIKIAGSL